MYKTKIDAQEEHSMYTKNVTSYEICFVRSALF